MPNSIYTTSLTPCGRFVIYSTEVSTWEGNGRPDPITGKPIDYIELEQIGTGDDRRWVGQTPSGAFIRLYND